MPAKTTQLRALPQFMRFLAAFPHPATVPRSIALGPLASFGATTCFFAFKDGESLRTMGGFGFSDEEMDRYTQVPLSLVSPAARAFHESEVVIEPLDEVISRYDFIALDYEMWQTMRARVGDGDMVHAPICAQGTTLGVYGFNTSVRNTWDSLDISYLDGLSAILGIWATHALSGVRTPEVWRPITSANLALTERQLEILQLVESGKSNAAIAFALGYSASTVKAEMQRVLRVLKVSDRTRAVARARELGLMPDPDDAVAGSETG